MIITSPENSFVDFNGTPLNCKGFEEDLSLPVFDNFGIKFQFDVLDVLVPNNTVFYAAVCNTDCTTIYDPNYVVPHICNRYVLNIAGTPLVDSDFPIIVTSFTPGPYQPVIPAGTYDRTAFLSVLSDSYDFNIPGYDFISCCAAEIPVISGIQVRRASGGGTVSLQMSSYFASGYVNFPASSMNGIVGLDQCFRYCILNAAKQVIGCSNLFYRIYDPCYTSVFNYYNEENSYGFKYVVLPNGDITENQIRLFIHFNKPSYEVQENVFRQSNNSQRRTSTNVQRLWQGNVGYLSDEQHLKVVYMLKHDSLHVYYGNKNLDTYMLQTGDYTNDYPEIDDYVSSPASFLINDFTRSYTNNNCGFDCGVEVLDSCTGSVSPGGNTSKYHIEFTIPTGAMGIGATTYINSNFIGATDVEVYREGLMQYKSGSNFYSFNSATGQISVFPAVRADERFSIWAI